MRPIYVLYVCRYKERLRKNFPRLNNEAVAQQYDDPRHFRHIFIYRMCVVHIETVAPISQTFIDILSNT